MKKIFLSVFTFAFAGFASAQGETYALNNIGKEVSLKDISANYADCNCYVLDTTFFVGLTANRTAVRRSGHLSNYGTTPSATRGLSASADAGWAVSGVKITLNKPCYYLPGVVHVDSLVNFNIPAGTKLYGSKLSFSAFVQLPGSTVNAKGSAGAPIIFTSAQANRSRGDWGGIVIAGRAPIAGDVSSYSVSSRGNFSYIEGLPKAKPYFVGGTNGNDNSGLWSWVQSNYAGLNVGAQGSGNELNSFSLYGVGRLTKMNNLQVAYANDDAIEIFGGNVNIQNAFILNTLDDDIDLDGGYQGTIQNVLVYRLDSASRDVSRSRLAEISNKNVHHLRKTMPVITNVTAFGARSMVAKTYVFGKLRNVLNNWNKTGDSTIAGVKQYVETNDANARSMTGFSIDKNASARIYNSIVYGYDQAFNVSDATTGNNLHPDTLWGPQFAFNAWGKCVNDGTHSSAGFAVGNAFPFDNPNSWTRYYQSSNYKANSDDIKNLGYYVTVGQGVYPAISSIVIGGAHKSEYGTLANTILKLGSGFGVGGNDTLNTYRSSGSVVNMVQRGVLASKLTGFSLVTDEDYCGSGLPFGGDNQTNDENNSAELTSTSLELFAINPSEGAINVTIENAKTNQMSDVHVYDMSGKLVKSSIVSGKDVNVTGMPIGLYTVVVSSNNTQDSIKVFVQ